MQVTRVRVHKSSRGFRLFVDYRSNTGKRARLFKGSYTNRAELDKAIDELQTKGRVGIGLVGTGGV